MRVFGPAVTETMPPYHPCSRSFSMFYLARVSGPLCDTDHLLCDTDHAEELTLVVWP